MSAPLLELAGVARRFGAVRAADGVDFAVPAGSITGLIGPNGAGKSTTFNLIAGDLRPEAGAIRLDGRRIDGLPPDRIFRAGLARTFQIPRPFPAMTVLENLMLAPTNQHGERFWLNWIAPGSVARSEARLKDRARAILDFTGLGAKAGDPAGELSGGQQKLLELARVLMAEPRLILLDEPAAGVNPSLLRTLVEKIQVLNQEGTTFLIIEHDMDLVMRLCRPVVVMAQGQVIASGDPEAVRRDPRVLDAYLGDLAA